MTVLLAVAVVPKDGSKPYVVIGSDTKKVGTDIESGNVYEDNKFQKVYEINNKLIGVTGQFTSKFLGDFLEFIEDNDCAIEDLTERCFLYVKQHVLGTPFEEARIGVFIGSVVDLTPALGIIQVKKEGIEEAFYNVESIKENVLKISNFKKDRDIMDDFSTRISNNLDFNNVSEAATTCLMRAAARRPEGCNLNIEIKVLGRK